MSLADDCMPEDCLEICAKEIQENLLAITKHIPTGNECSASELAKKWTVLGRCLRRIKDYTKEALKSVQMGSDSTAFHLIEASKHKTLGEFADTKLEITGPDGSKVETTLEKFEDAADAVQRDPGLAQEAE